MNICYFRNSSVNFLSTMDIKADTQQDLLNWMEQEEHGYWKSSLCNICKVIFTELLGSSKRIQCDWLGFSLAWFPKVITMEPHRPMLRSLPNSEDILFLKHPPLPTSTHSQTWSLTEILISQIYFYSLKRWVFRNGLLIYNHPRNPKT